MLRVKRLLSEGKPQEAGAYLRLMLNRPDHFWDKLGIVHHHDSILQKDGSYNVTVSCGQFMWEDVGLLVLQLVQHLVEEREQRLGLVVQVASEANKRRKYSLDPRTKNRKWRTNKMNKKMNDVPHTMIKCAEILLAEGDTLRLSAVFDGFVANPLNTSGEEPLLVLRSVSVMLDRKARDAESDAASYYSGTSFTSGGGGAVDTTIDTMSRLLLGAR